MWMFHIDFMENVLPLPVRNHIWYNKFIDLDLQRSHKSKKVPYIRFKSNDGDSDKWFNFYKTVLVGNALIQFYSLIP